MRETTNSEETTKGLATPRFERVAQPATIKIKMRIISETYFFVFC